MQMLLFDQNISFWGLMAGASQVQFIIPALLVTLVMLEVGAWAWHQCRVVQGRWFALWAVWTLVLFLPCLRSIRWPFGYSSYQILTAMIVIAWLLFTTWGLWNSIDAASETTSESAEIESRQMALYLIVISILAAILRYCLRNDVSGDYNNFLDPWYQTMKDGGIKILGTQVGDYNLPYQAVIYLMTLLPIRPLYAYKLVSCVFDYILAAGVYSLTRQLTGSRRVSILAYTILLFFPQVYIDSAHWAQCDAIYVTFLVWALVLYLQEHYRRAFLLIGIALSFKLQAVFILPFYGLCWLLDRRHGFTRFLWAIPGFYLCCIPGIVMGRSLLDPFLAYLTQTTEYSAIRFNFPSFWGIFYEAGTHSDWNRIAIILTAVMLLMGMMQWFLRNKRDNSHKSDELLLRLAIWSIWTCVLFLPNMHERYGYALDILMIVLYLVTRDLREVPVIGLCQMCSMMCYGTARLELGCSPWLFRVVSALYTLLYILYCLRVFLPERTWDRWPQIRNASREHT